MTEKSRYDQVTELISQRGATEVVRRMFENSVRAEQESPSPDQEKIIEFIRLMGRFGYEVDLLDAQLKAATESSPRQ